MIGLRYYPSDDLKRTALRVELFDQDLIDLVAEMVDRMYEGQGVGLAANQIGSQMAVIVIDHTSGERSDSLKIMVNPTVRCEGKTLISREGCLSLPGIGVDVERSETCHVDYQDTKGQSREVTLTGFESFIVQHEIDHLNGLTILDKVPLWKRKKLLKELRRREDQ